MRRYASVCVDRTWTLASMRAARVAPARAQQGQKLDRAPEQGTAEGQRGMGDEASHHGCRLPGLGEGSVTHSEIVEQPDHHPRLVEKTVDVAEESVDQGFHDGFPCWMCQRPKDRRSVLQAVFTCMTNPVHLAKCRQGRKNPSSLALSSCRHAFRVRQKRSWLWLATANYEISHLRRVPIWQMGSPSPILPLAGEATNSLATLGHDTARLAM